MGWLVGCLDLSPDWHSCKQETRDFGWAWRWIHCGFSWGGGAGCRPGCFPTLHYIPWHLYHNWGRINFSQGILKVFSCSVLSTICLVDLIIQWWLWLACRPLPLAFASVSGGQHSVSVDVCQVTELGCSLRQITLSRSSQCLSSTRYTGIISDLCITNLVNWIFGIYYIKGESSLTSSTSEFG
jgi:hypothetical protein